MSLTFKFIKFITALIYIFAPTIYIMYIVISHFPEVGKSGASLFILCLFISSFFAATLADLVKWYENKQQNGN